MAHIGLRDRFPEWLRARWGWVVCAAAFLLHLGISSLSYTYGLFFIVIQHELNATAVETGWIGSVIWGVQMFSSPIAACLESFLGYRGAIVITVIVSAVAIFVSSFAQTVYQLYITLGVIHGLTLGIAWFIQLSVLVQHFPSKNSVRAVSFATMGSASAMLLISEPVSISVEVMGWRPTFQFIALFTMVVALPPAFLISPPSVNEGVEPGCSKSDECLESLKTPELEKTVDEDDDAGPSKLLEQPTSDVAVRQATNKKIEYEGDVTGATQPLSRLERWKTVLTFNAFLFCAFTVTSAMSYSVFIINIASYYDSIGLDIYQVATLLTITCGLELATKFTLATLGERFPYKKTYLLLLQMICLVGLSMMMTLTTALWYLVMISITIGILRACYNVLLYMCCIETLGKNCPDEAITLVTISRGIGYLTGTIPAGAIYDTTGSYGLSFLLVAAISTFSAISLGMVLLRPTGKSEKDGGAEVNMVWQARLQEVPEGCGYMKGRLETSV